MTAGDRAASLTRQLLAYAGKGALVRQPVDVSEIAADTLRLLRPSLPAWVELREELTTGLPPVLMDPSQAQQVTANLVVNAAEAIDGHPGAVTVRTWAERSHVCLEVADTGCGMDEATRARAFEPFFSTKFTGRGLGLAAVKGIVRATGGAIDIESAPGEGTRFRIRLPAARLD
jgi:signal transduction histidine kinase